ncbi:hypothetical protein SAMN05216419_105312 [Nitrosomonas cryotolerans]|uniref:PEGA domain-containing protein n=1 Tax=Nitrosomonas cryotolerans ATCC 49181 TaxID=1131553 RepID=A0A1N6GAF5_9PROT|nr:hypothetical protein [Nitrosomonas cryotolerans]SFQ06183.1 hypothetical protein SAMN05216419_105312 [Nitrosomonas cryotolerans]SIO04505.1 hypothetical protein SAMN02743940_0623 [Nitrosomonas cryotolerans ATCC 49181]
MKRITCVALTAITLLSGCAAMINGTTQQVSVRSNVQDAKIYANEEFIGTGNGVAVFRKKDDYVITARKDGCNDTSIAASKSFDATTLLGLLIDFGLISILLVDGAVTGAWNRFDRTNYMIDMQCNTAKLQL